MTEDASQNIRPVRSLPGLLALGATLLLCAAAVSLPSPAQAATLDDDFSLYKKVIKEYYHARYEGKPDPEVLADVAKRIKADPTQVSDVFKRGKALSKAYSDKLNASVSGWIKGKNVRTALGPATLDGKLKLVAIDASTAHVVAYIKWAAGDRPILEEEACLAAKAVAQASKLIDTVALGGVKGGDDNAVFTAKISREAADRIDFRRIGMFADKRYIKLFEEVKFK